MNSNVWVNWFLNSRLAKLGLTASAIAIASVLLWQPKRALSAPVAVPSAEFCILAPKEAHADVAERADVVASVEVPAQTPAPGILAASRSASQGEVIRVTVRSSRPGAVIVHGLMDARTIDKAGTVTVAFRAIYGGRFPLHFHGVDGSHFEVVAFEIRPAV